MATMKINRGFLSFILVIAMAAVFALTFTACQDTASGYMLDALIGKIDELPDEITLDHEDEIQYLNKVYDALPDERKQKVTNYQALQTATETLNDLHAIDALEVSFTSGDGFVVGEQYLPAIDMSNLTFKGKTPTVSYAIVPGCNNADAVVNADGSVTAAGIGAVKLQAQLRYEGYHIVKTSSYDLTVSGYPVSVKVSLPDFVRNTVHYAQVSSRYEKFTYDSEKAVFVGSMPLGEHEIVCAYGGMKAVMQQVTVSSGENAFEVTLSELNDGSARVLGAKASGEWTRDDQGVVKIRRGKNEDTSVYSIANGFSHTNVMVSATVRMQVGIDGGHKSNAEGAGIMIADTAGGAYGIILKPGQGYIVLTKGSMQNISGIPGTELSNIMPYHDSVVNGSNGRVQTGMFNAVKGKSSYDVTAKLTVVRMDSMIYVVLNDVLCARFENTELDGAAGGIGLVNFNHDLVTFSDISFTTLDEPMEAALGNRLLDIQLGEMNGAAVTLQGDSNGRVMPGDRVTFTVTPAEGKPVWVSVNGRLIAGQWNADGSLTYTHTATGEGMRISTQDISQLALHSVQVKVELPAEVQSWTDKVQVTSGGSSFRYDPQTGAYVGDLPQGAAQITAHLPGMEPATVDMTVAADGTNAASVKLTDFVYGPGKAIGSKMSGIWAYTSGKVTVKRGAKEDTSYCTVAEGITSTNVMISATVTMQVGAAGGHASNAEGAGILFATTEDALYGIGLKPGQGSVILTRNDSQNVSAFAGMGEDDVTCHNGSSMNTANGNGRVWVPVLESTKGQSRYTVTVKITVVRRNTDLYVYLDDQLYVSYEVPELDDVAGGLGLFNLNHDGVTFENITFTTVDVEKYIP